MNRKQMKLKILLPGSMNDTARLVKTWRVSYVYPLFIFHLDIMIYTGTKQGKMTTPKGAS